MAGTVEAVGMAGAVVVPVKAPRTAANSVDEACGLPPNLPPPNDGLGNFIFFPVVFAPVPFRFVPAVAAVDEVAIAIVEDREAPTGTPQGTPIWPNLTGEAEETAETPCDSN